MWWICSFGQGQPPIYLSRDWYHSHKTVSQAIHFHFLHTISNQTWWWVKEAGYLYTQFEMKPTINLHTVKQGFSSTSTGSTPKNAKEDLDGKWLGFFPSGANQRVRAILPVSVNKWVAMLIHLRKTIVATIKIIYTSCMWQPDVINTTRTT